MHKGVAVILLLALGACSPATQPSSAPGLGTAQSAAPPRVTGQAPAGALVMLEPLDSTTESPAGPAVMDQFSKAFVPETLFVRVGQSVTFKNSEDQLHNVTVIRSRTGTRVFNISQNQGDVYEHVFEQVGEYNVSCDVHPGMQATIVAATTPFATFADAGGAYAFDRVPDGRYRVRIAADGRDTEQTVAVEKGTATLLR